MGSTRLVNDMAVLFSPLATPFLKAVRVVPPKITRFQAAEPLRVYHPPGLPPIYKSLEIPSAVVRYFCAGCAGVCGMVRSNIPSVTIGQM